MLKLSNQRAVTVSESERQAARDAIKSFDTLVARLKGARSRDAQVVDILKKNQDATSQDLFEIRNLIRRFQTEVKDRYSKIIIDFAGKKDTNNNSLTEGYVHNFKLLEKDTTVGQIKLAIVDAMQQLTDYLETFLETFEDFNNPDQIKEIINTSQKADALVQSIENVIEKQMKPYFEKNIIKVKVSELRSQIVKRARIIKLLEVL